MAIEEAVEPALEHALVVHDGAVEVDAELRAMGEPHLARLRAANPGMFDGTVLALERIDGGVAHVRRASYFDMVATCDALAGDAAMRAHAESLMDPGGSELARLRVPAGRAAAIGATLVVVRDRRFALGRRSDRVALDPGRWHVVSSGVIDERGLRGTLAAELADEHGLGPDALDGARVIALGYDLGRLRPELVVITRDLGPLPPPRPSHEFERVRDIPLDRDAIAALWREYAPTDLTPAAALALVALERELEH